MYPRPWAAPCGPTGRRTQRVTGFMQELTSDGKSGRYPKSRLFGYLLWWCRVGSKLLGNDILKWGTQKRLLKKQGSAEPTVWGSIDARDDVRSPRGSCKPGRYPVEKSTFERVQRGSCKSMVNLAGRYPKSRLFGYLLWSPEQRVTGFMQELTSDGKSGRYPKSRLFGYLLSWCWVGSKLLGNDILNGDEGSASRGSCKR